MIFSPIPGFDRKDMTQGFGERPEYYKRYGLAAHNGCDLRCPIGTMLYAACEGYLTMGNQGNIGYGRWVKITSESYTKDGTRREITFGHLSNFIAGLKDGDFVYAGDVVGVSGSSGDSTGPHVHVTYKKLSREGKVLNNDNGFHGAIDVAEFIELWELGNLLKP